jgi:hypothetical protein
MRPQSPIIKLVKISPRFISRRESGVPALAGDTPIAASRRQRGQRARRGWAPPPPPRLGSAAAQGAPPVVGWSGWWRHDERDLVAIGSGQKADIRGLAPRGLVRAIVGRRGHLPPPIPARGEDMARHAALVRAEEPLGQRMVEARGYMAHLVPQIRRCAAAVASVAHQKMLLPRTARSAAPACPVGKR